MKVALVAASMLVLQALLGAFALGTAAASPMLDAFGNTLCITSTDAAEHGSHKGEHTALPDCCTVACGMFAFATADDRSPNSVSNPLVPALALAMPAFHVTLPARGVDYPPANPRAPPQTV